MKNYSIFPHKGYLNTDYQINEFDNTDRLFFIDNSTTPVINPKSFRLPAGKHIVKSNIAGEEYDVVEVEDAIRLGGSKIEAGYCFDNSPWVVAVMKDRAYFLNSATGIQYVENGISPLKITALKKDLFLFEYGSKNESGVQQIEEYIVFDAAQGKVVKRFDKYIFHNSDMALFTDRPTEEGVYLHVMCYGDNLNIVDIQCKNYTVCDGVLYYCAISDDKYKIMKLKSDGTSKEVPYYNGPQNRFIGFALNHYYLTRYDGYYHLKDLLKPSAFIGRRLSNHNGIIKEINGIRIEKADDLLDGFSTLVNNNKDICAKLSLQVHLIDYVLYEIGKGLYARITHHSYPWKTIDKKNNVVSWEFGMIGGTTSVTIGQWDKIYKSKDFVVIHNSEKTIVIQDGKIVRELGSITIKRTPQGKLIYHKDNQDDTRCVYAMGANEDELLIQGKIDDINVQFVTQYGILTEKSKHYRILQIDEGRWIDMPHHKYVLLEKNGSCFLNDCDENGQSYLLTATANPIALPVNVSKIISISSNGSSILSESPRGMILHEKYSVNSSYEINEKLIDAIDTSEYRNALFSEDGNHTIYQKNGAWYYYNTETEKEVEFEMIPEVLKCQKKGMYGMNFYSRFDDTSRRVELIDPISLQNIPPLFLSDYKFVSPSGRLATKTSIAGVNIRYFLSNKKMGEEELEFDIDITRLFKKDELSALNGNPEYLKHLETAFPGSAKKDWEKVAIDEFAARLNKEEGPKDRYCLYARKYALIDIFPTENESAFTRIELPVNLGYLNNVSFSHDDRYVSICGKTIIAGTLINGFVGVYDLQQHDWIFGPLTPRWAIWKSFFSPSGIYAYYDSMPNSKYGNVGNPLQDVERRSILTFSRSGEYIALSDKGYIPYSSNPSCWGHMKSANIYIRKVGIEKELCFSDHGDEIMDLRSADVTCVSFSPDDKKLMSVSQDGVIIIRNLHLEELSKDTYNNAIKKTLEHNTSLENA